MNPRSVRHKYRNRLASDSTGPVLALLLVPVAILALAACVPPGDGEPTQRPTSTIHQETPSPSPSPSATPSPTPSPSPTPEPSPTPSPTPEPLPNAFTVLQDDLAAMLDSHPGPAGISIAVTDLQSGQAIHVRGEEPRYAGCVVNLYVLVATLQEVQAGNLSRSEVEDLIYRTTWSSNAATAFELYRLVGDGNAVEGTRKVAALHDALDLSEGTLLDHPPAYAAHSLGIDANNYVTALDVNGTLAELHQGKLLDGTHTALLLDAMATVKPGLNYLTASGVPASATVHHKNGFFPSSDGFVDNDAGIVTFRRDGQEYAYAVTFLSEDNPEKYHQLPLAQRMMARIWQYFEQAY